MARTEAAEDGRDALPPSEDIRPEMDSVPLVCPLKSTEPRCGLTIGSLRETARAEGEGGGGMATELGTRALGVLIDRVLVGVPEFDTEPRPALGVNGELMPRVGDTTEELSIAEDMPNARVGLLIAALEGLSVPDFRLLSCLAVIPTYREARDPGVIPEELAVFFAGVKVMVRVRVTGNAVPGVRRPFIPGVIRPLTGVTRPLDKDGVFLPLDIEDVELGTRPVEGVSRPLRTEATDEGRDMLPGPTVGAESLSAPMKTPQAGGHVK